MYTFFKYFPCSAMSQRQGDACAAYYIPAAISAFSPMADISAVSSWREKLSEEDSRDWTEERCGGESGQSIAEMKTEKMRE